MTKTLYRFKVRKWSDVNSKPFDIVFLDEELNNQHYSSNASYETLGEAFEAAQILDNCLVINLNGTLENIRTHWPIDGVVVS